MKNKKEIYGYDRLDQRIAYREYGRASKWVDLTIYALGLLLGVLAYNLVW